MSAPPTDAWTTLLGQLFPVAVPERAGWTDPDAIHAMTSQLAGQECALVCTPDQSCTVLRGVIHGSDLGTLELSTDTCRYLVRPKGLTLEAFEGHSLTYLRLSALALGPGIADRPLSLAEHNRVRVENGQAFVWFALSSPLSRVTNAPELATWGSRQLHDYVVDLQSTMLMQTT